MLSRARATSALLCAIPPDCSVRGAGDGDGIRKDNAQLGILVTRNANELDGVGGGVIVATNKRLAWKRTEKERGETIAGLGLCSNQAPACNAAEHRLTFAS